jgi:hypothetical protein
MRDDPAYVAMIRARITIAITAADPAMIRRVMATQIRETPSVETIALDGDTMLFNRNFVLAESRSPAGRERLVREITDQFNDRVIDDQVREDRLVPASEYHFAPYSGGVFGERRDA